MKETAANDGGAPVIDVNLNAPLFPKMMTPWGSPIGDPIYAELSQASLPADSSGYTSLKQEKNSIQVENLIELIDDGWAFVNWNGVVSRPLYTQTGTIYGLLAGRPEDPNWDDLCREMSNAMDKERQSPAFPGEEVTFDKTRGAFPAINVGIHHGLGSPHPTNNQLKGQLNTIMPRLLDNEAIQKIAKWQNEVFQFWAPRLYDHYKNTLHAVLEDDRSKNRKNPLRPTFPNISVWPTAAFNFGPSVWCQRHRDIMDLAYGWCSILALGEFDPDNGGHLVLPDIRTVVRFPPGSTIMIPSSTLTHSNTPVNVEGKVDAQDKVNQAPDAPEEFREDLKERRISFTQYSGGGLFRWVDCGFQTEKDLRLIPDKFSLHEETKAKKWQDGWELLSHIRDFYQN